MEDSKILGKSGYFQKWTHFLPYAIGGFVGVLAGAILALSSFDKRVESSINSQDAVYGAAQSDASFDARAEAWLERRIEKITDRLTEEFILRARLAQDRADLENRAAEKEEAGRLSAVLDSVLPTLQLDDPGSIVEGSIDDSALVVVAFGDYNCPHCKSMHSVLRDLSENGVDGIPVRVVHRPFPILGQGSLAAARAVLGAKSLGLDAKSVQDAFYSSSVPIDVNSIKFIMAGAGVDANAAIEAGIDSGITEAIGRNRASASSIGINGTPSFIVGRSLVVGAVGKDGMVAAIRRELSRNDSDGLRIDDVSGETSAPAN